MLLPKNLFSCSDSEIYAYIRYLDAEDKKLAKEFSYYAYKDRKRKLIQAFVKQMCDETFAELGCTIVDLSEKYQEFMDSWVEDDFVKAKSKEHAYAADGHNMVGRAKTGFKGELAVILSLGGNLADFDSSVGPSTNYSKKRHPDLSTFLGMRVGVKTSKTKSGHNFPLVPLGKVINPEVIVGQNNNKQDRFYVLGVVSPIDIVNGSHPVFTVDPNASNPDKRGGAKYGYWDYRKLVRFTSKEELIEILMREEFKPLKIK